MSLPCAILKVDEFGRDRLSPFYTGGIACQGKGVDPAGNEERAAIAVSTPGSKRVCHDLMRPVHQRAREARYPAARACASVQKISSARV